MSIIEAKIVVLGSTGVGKTSIVVRYIGDGFNKQVSPTIGASFFTCSVPIESYTVKLQVWDTAGQERFRSMAPMYYRKANAALLVYDMTSEESFGDMQSWVNELHKNIDSNIVLCVIGNKSDLAEQRAVRLDMAQDYAASINAFHFETSAFSYDGIERVFLHIAKSLIFAYETELDHQLGTYNHGLDPTSTNRAADNIVKLHSRKSQPKSGKSKNCCS